MVYQIIASCVDKEKLADCGVDYLYDDIDLAADTITVLEFTKEKIQQKIKVNFSVDINDEVVAPPPLYKADTIVIPSTLEQYPIKLDSDGRANIEAAVSLLSFSSKNDYALLRRTFMDVYNIPKECFPTYYKITKHRPPIDSFDVEVSEESGELQKMDNLDIDSNTTALNVYHRLMLIM